MTDKDQFVNPYAPHLPFDVDYDMDAYVNKYGPPDQSNGQHLTDEFKLPNHITFSDQSIYHSDQTPGGRWSKENDKWHFYPSEFNLKQYSPDRLKRYFETHEPDSVLHLSENKPMANSFDKAFDSVFDDAFDKVYDKVEAPQKKRTFSEAFMESQDKVQNPGAAIPTMNEEPTPFIADQYNTLGRKGFVDRYVRPVTEGGGLTLGSMMGLAGGPWTEPLGGAYGYDFGVQTADQLAGDRPFWSPYKPNPRNLEVGATMAMGGPLVGKYLPPTINWMSDTYTGATNWLAKKMPWTQTAIENKVGNTLADNMGRSPQYALNNMATTELEGTIPGYKTSLGERTADPGLIKFQRSQERRPGPYADAKVQNIADNQAAMRDYLNTEFTGNETIDDVIEALNRRKIGLDNQTKSAANKVDEVKGSLPVKDPQETGRAITSEIESQRFPAKQEVKAKYDAIPNEPIPPSNTSKAIEDLEKNFRPGDEDVYPKRAIDRVKEALKGKHPENQEPGPDMIIGYAKDGRPVLQKETADLQVRAFKGETVENPIVSETPIPGFQDLHSLRKDIGRQIKSAKFSGNDELAMKLQDLKNGIDADIEVGMTGKDLYDEARKSYIDYAQRFKTGAIADIRQPGKEITGLNMPSASIGKKIFTPDGADDFIRAVGQDKAGLIAEGHAAQDLISSNVVNKSTGEINAKALDNWLAKNKPVLDKYGITADFENVQSAQHSLDAAKAQMDRFDKSVAGKILGSDPQKAIAAAFQGADKKTGQVMFDLLKKVEGNPEALRGLQNAFKDFIIDKAETTASSIATDRILGPASIIKDMKKYESAMRMLYEKDPQKLEALVNIQKAIETSARSLKSPLGGGSDTLENAASGFGSHVMGSIMAKLPGGDFAIKLGRIGLGALNKLGQKEFDQLMVRAMYDPELAQTLISATRGTASKDAIAVQMDRHLTQAGLGGFGAVRASNDEDDIRRSLQQDKQIKKGLETVVNAIVNPKNLGYKDHIAMMEDQIQDRNSALNKAAEWVVYNLSPPGMMYTGAKAITERGVPKSVMQVAETVNDLFNMIPPGAAETALAKLGSGGALAIIAGPKAKFFKDAEGKFSALYDKMPRFEIDDSAASLRLANIPTNRHNEKLLNVPIGNSKYEMTLGSILKHDELFKNYPDLKNIPIKSTGMNFSINGAYDSGKDAIYMAGGKPEEFMKTLMHEVQHAIQSREGFAGGSSTRRFLPDNHKQIKTELTNELKSVEERAKRFMDRSPEPWGYNQFTTQAIIEELEKGTKLSPYHQEVWKELQKFPEIDQLKSLKIRQSELMKTEREAVDKYLRSAGEIEAREVSASVGIPNTEKGPIYSRTDQNKKIPLDQMIVKQAAGVGEGGGLSGLMDQIAYHGSPKGGIKKFSTDYIGTGEGSQAFGRGLYFTSFEEIANHYRDKLSISSQNWNDDVWESAIKLVDDGLQFRGPKLSKSELKEVAIDHADFALDSVSDRHSARKFADKIMKRVNDLDENKFSFKNGQLHYDDIPYEKYMDQRGQTYKVDIPEDTDLLHWDKPLSEQPEKVKELLRKEGIEVDVKPYQITHKDLNVTHESILNESSRAKSVGFDPNKEGLKYDLMVNDGPDRKSIAGQVRTDYTKYEAISWDSQSKITSSRSDADDWILDQWNNREPKKITGEDFYRKLSGEKSSFDMKGDQAASEYLQSLGIPGHKYPAGTIMGAPPPKIDWGGVEPSKEIKRMINSRLKLDDAKDVDDILSNMKRHLNEWETKAQSPAQAKFYAEGTDRYQDIQDAKETIKFLEKNGSNIKIDHPYNFVIYDDSAIINTEGKQLVHHASPVTDITQFDKKFLRSGEGGNAFGSGFYFTNKEEIADHYKRGFAEHKGFAKKYKAYIPQDMDLLHWDKTLDKQPIKVKQILEKSNVYEPELTGEELYNRIISLKMHEEGKKQGKLLLGTTNRDIGSKLASEHLYNLGIPGHRYPAGTLSGSKKSDSYNYVIYDPEHINVANYEGRKYGKQGPTKE